MSDERDDHPERREIKVTDKRMFTPDGELREEYRTSREASPPAAEGPAESSEPAGGGSPMATPSGAPPAAPPGGPGARPAEAPGGPGVRPVEPPGGPGARPAEAPGGAGAERPPLELPPTGPGPQPSFFDLLGILAEPATIYLGDVELPDGSSAENLDAARLHIDLLDVLRRKTAGNLTAQESAVLEDVLYRLRMRYVQKRG